MIPRFTTSFFGFVSADWLFEFRSNVISSPMLVIPFSGPGGTPAHSPNFLQRYCGVSIDTYSLVKVTFRSSTRLFTFILVLYILIFFTIYVQLEWHSKNLLPLLSVLFHLFCILLRFFEWIRLHLALFP